MRKRISLAVAALLAGVTLSEPSVAAVSYPHQGTVNPLEYTFTAAHNGDVYATFAGSSTSFDAVIGAIVGNALSPVTGLGSHSAGLGDTIDFGVARPGEEIVLIDYVRTTENTWYSDKSRNNDGITHIYATPVSANQVYYGSPAGVYVTFEDQRAGSSDYDYNDIALILHNVNLYQAPRP